MEEKKKNHNAILQLETDIVKTLKSIYDPEIPVNIYDLGLVYDINIDTEKSTAEIVMTLTAPNCPIADQILMEVKNRVEFLDDINECTVNLVFDPPWDQTMMSEEALLELGML
ncbi:MAG: iron-sulfur cluster assembly protein [Bacteroidales bacterium]